MLVPIGKSTFNAFGPSNTQRAKAEGQNGEELYEKQNYSTENKAKEGGYEEEIG